jgi:hypothetical protein
VVYSTYGVAFAGGPDFCIFFCLAWLGFILSRWPLASGEERGEGRGEMEMEMEMEMGMEMGGMVRIEVVERCYSAGVVKLGMVVGMS